MIEQNAAFPQRMVMRKGKAAFFVVSDSGVRAPFARWGAFFSPARAGDAMDIILKVVV